MEKAPHTSTTVRGKSLTRSCPLTLCNTRNYLPLVSTLYKHKEKQHDLLRLTEQVNHLSFTNAMARPALSDWLGWCVPRASPGYHVELSCLLVNESQKSKHWRKTMSEHDRDGHLWLPARLTGWLMDPPPESLSDWWMSCLVDGRFVWLVNYLTDWWSISSYMTAGWVTRKRANSWQKMN